MSLRNPPIQAALIVITTFVAYVPAISGGFIWDDDDYVINNDTLRDLHGLRRIWFEVGAVPQYYPLVHTTFWLEHHLWGLNPHGYHAVNVFLHAVNALVLWRLLLRLSAPGAFLAAWIFALHPVHVESVAWITERKNVLSGLFYLSAMHAYLRFCMPVELGFARPTDNPAARSWSFYALAAVLFLFALFSKTVTSTFPAAVLLLIWWKRGRLALRDLWPLLPLLIVGAGLGRLTASMETNLLRAIGPDWDRTLIERVLIAGRALWFYAGKLLVPYPLTFVYPRWTINAASAGQYLYPVSALAVMAGLWLLRRRWGVGPLVAVLFFAGTLTPALGFFNVFPHVFSYVADHFQYLASIGLITLLAALLTRAAGRLGPWQDRLGLPCAAIYLAVLGSLTWRQGRIYEGLETLWRQNLSLNPNSFLAHNNLGMILNDRGDLNGAMHHFRETIRLKPNFGRGYNNLAGILMGHQRVDEAIPLYNEAVRLWPDYAEAHSNLGYALGKAGKTSEAVRHLQIALRLKPTMANAHGNLGIVLDGAGQTDEAIRHYREAIRLSPDKADFHCNLGVALIHQGKLPDAMAAFREALRLNPNHVEAHFDLGLAHDVQRRDSEAIAEYSEALRLKPEHAGARNNLAAALLRSNRIDDAIAQYEKAIALAPDSPESYNNLAWLRATHPNATVRRGDAAVRLAEKARDLNRDARPDTLDTLAAAYAEAGRLPEAIAAASKAIELATRSGQGPLADSIRARLDLYRAGKPYHEVPR